MGDVSADVLARLEKLPASPLPDPKRSVAERELDRLVGHGLVEDPSALLQRLTRGWFRSMMRLQLAAVTKSDHSLLASSELRLRRVHDSLLAHSSSPSSEAFVRREWLRALLELNALALEFAQPRADATWVERGTLTGEVLKVVAGKPGASNSEILAALGRTRSHETQLSRALAKLRARGLVIRNRSGVRSHWELTPRGRAIARRLDPRKDSQEDGMSAQRNGRDLSVEDLLSVIDRELNPGGNALVVDAGLDSHYSARGGARPWVGPDDVEKVVESTARNMGRRTSATRQG